MQTRGAFFARSQGHGGDAVNDGLSFGIQMSVTVKAVKVFGANLYFDFISRGYFDPFYEDSIKPPHPRMWVITETAPPPTASSKTLAG